MVLVEKQEMTFEDFVFSSYDEQNMISKVDWYNVVLLTLQEDVSSDGLVGISLLDYDLKNYLTRWYEYEIVLDPHETIVNEVMAPIYPNIDGSYNPAIYEYTYLLSPASTWKEFNELEIYINTPYELLECDIPLEKTEKGYYTVLDGLPESELIFKLSSDSNPKREYNTPYLFVFMLPILLPLFLLIIIILWVIRRKKNKCER